MVLEKVSDGMVRELLILSGQFRHLDQFDTRDSQQSSQTVWRVAGDAHEKTLSTRALGVFCSSVGSESALPNIGLPRRNSRRNNPRPFSYVRIDITC